MHYKLLCIVIWHPCIWKRENVNICCRMSICVSTKHSLGNLIIIFVWQKFELCFLLSLCFSIICGPQFLNAFLVSNWLIDPSIYAFISCWLWNSHTQIVLLSCSIASFKRSLKLLVTIFEAITWLVLLAKVTNVFSL